MRRGLRLVIVFTPCGRGGGVLCRGNPSHSARTLNTSALLERGVRFADAAVEAPGFCVRFVRDRRLDEKISAGIAIFSSAGTTCADIFAPLRCPCGGGNGSDDCVCFMTELTRVLREPAALRYRKDGWGAAGLTGGCVRSRCPELVLLRWPCPRFRWARQARSDASST